MLSGIQECWYCKEYKYVKGNHTTVPVVFFEVKYVTIININEHFKILLTKYTIEIKIV